MKNAILATIALGTIALTSCGSDPYYQNQGGPPPGGHRPGGGGGSEAYGTGQRDGARDARSGRRYDPARNQGSVPRPFQDSYRSGYSSGYRSNDGGGGGGGGNWGGGGGGSGGGNWGGGGGGGGNWGGGGGGGGLQARQQQVFQEGYARGQRTAARGGPFIVQEINAAARAYGPQLAPQYNVGFKAGYDSVRKGR